MMHTATKMFATIWTIVFVLLAVDDVASETITCNSADNDGSCTDNNPNMDPSVTQWIQNLPTVTKNSLYLNGAWTKPTQPTATDIDVIDPSTGQSIAHVPVASKIDVDFAVINARKALDDWSIDTTMDERNSIVSKLVRLYKKHAEQMAQLISHEMGAPIDLSRQDQVGSGSYVMEQFLHEVDRSRGGGFESEYRLDEDTTILHQAIGVVGLITPWNWPMNQIALKVIPALLVGCTVILKPSEQTPLSALFFGQLIDMAGFPAGVFQLVNGYGPNHVGEWLASHAGIDMVSFTGSTRGGKQVSLAAATTSKRVSLEMGGKGANIIFDDLIPEDDPEDLEDFVEAVESNVWQIMSNSGQTCNAPTRLLVPEQYWELALDVAKHAALDVQVGSAHEEGEHIGPVVSEAQYDRIQNYIQSGIDQGATLLVGGLGKPQYNPSVENDDEDSSDDESGEKLREHYQDGYYVQPTIFADCTPEMTIWREEIFGPVLCMTKFTTEKEAVELANDSPYGLTHYVHTYDKARRLRMAKRLQSGMIVMNQVGLASSAPFGGVKQSGNSREGGVWGLEDFCIVKAVSGMHGEDEDEIDDE